MLNHGRDQSIDAGLEYVAVWNAAMLQGGDVRDAVGAQLRRETAVFGDLKA